MFERGDFLLSPHCVWAELVLLQTCTSVKRLFDARQLGRVAYGQDFRVA